ncbi:hypothetical protein PspLS_11260 [Pyricularia sp. CBS 133598]|nr:hypothetical protein PspLS_11260 [Pyricularia sp. CBS 133598]
MSSTTKSGEKGSATASSGDNSSGNTSSTNSKGSETSNTSKSEASNTCNASSSGQVPEPTQCGICKEHYAPGDDHTCDPNDPHSSYFG